jgi:hypothetical protein
LTVVTLLEKAYGSFSARGFAAILSDLCKGLKVKVSIRNTASFGWIEVDVSGEDEAVALNLLGREIGIAPVSAERIGKFSNARGMVMNSDKSAKELYVDIGVFEPRFRVAAVSWSCLQSQLADGKKIPFQRLVEVFCLCDFMPLQIKVLGALNSRASLWDAELSEQQLSRFADWLDSNLDRLVVLGSTWGEIEQAVARGRHFRDVVRIDALGPFEHVVVCKLGTDAVGLMPKLGPYVGRASLMPFSPRRVRQLVGNPSL